MSDAPGPGGERWVTSTPPWGGPDPTGEDEGEGVTTAGPPGRRQGLLAANVVVASGTLLSRLTGLARVAALAYALGLDRLTDAYNLANNVPVIVYELLLGGILTASLVPLFVEADERRDERATSAIITVTALALAGLTVLATLGAPLIIRLYLVRAEGADVATYRSVATDLARWFLPQIFLLGCTALGTALLNARRRFVAFAYAPVLNNVVVIASFVAVRAMFDQRNLDAAARHPSLVTVLGLGSLLGSVAMVAALVVALRRAGVHLRWVPEVRHPAVRRLIRLSGWTIGYVVANQVALAIVTALAQSRSADYSAYVVAFQFFQLPHGLLAVSIMTTFAPDLAQAASRGDIGRFRDRTSLGLRLIVFLVLPAAVGYVTLAHPLATALLRYGSFSADDATRVAQILAAFALGLAAFSAYLFLLRSFYALQDTRTPFILNVIENGVNIVLALVLYDRYGVQGLAWSFALAYIVAAVLTFVVLGRRLGGFPARPTFNGLWRPMIAAVVMGEVVWLLTRTMGADEGRGALARLLAGTLIGVVLYLGLLRFLHAPELDYVTGIARRVRRRLRPAA